MPDLGRLLIIAGSILLLAGLLVVGLGRMHIPLGRLPGDISLRGRNWSFSFPSSPAFCSARCSAWSSGSSDVFAPSEKS